MKIYIEKDGQFIIITDEITKDNFETISEKQEVVNDSLDKLQDLSLILEITKQKEVKYLVKKLNNK